VSCALILKSTFSLLLLGRYLCWWVFSSPRVSSAMVYHV
jgi:hypothetical protein